MEGPIQLEHVQGALETYFWALQVRAQDYSQVQEDWLSVLIHAGRHRYMGHHWQFTVLPSGFKCPWLQPFHPSIFKV